MPTFVRSLIHPCLSDPAEIIPMNFFEKCLPGEISFWPSGRILAGNSGHQDTSRWKFDKSHSGVYYQSPGWYCPHITNILIATFLTFQPLLHFQHHVIALTCTNHVHRTCKRVSVQVHLIGLLSWKYIAGKDAGFVTQQNQQKVSCPQSDPKFSRVKMSIVEIE